MKLYISREKETIKMFKSPILEFFSKVYWFIPLVVYIPFILFLFWVSYFKYSISVTTGFFIFLCGMLFWSLLEYVMHRFVFHFHPKSKFGKRFFWTIHGVHHDYPSDPLRLVLPPSLSIPIAVILYALFYMTLGESYAPAFMAGTTVGYLFYDTCHYAIHHFPMKGVFWSKIREHHMRHHFQDSNLGFGVSSSIWDVVFRTNFKDPAKRDRKN